MFVQVYYNKKDERRVSVMCSPDEVSKLIDGDQEIRQGLRVKYLKADANVDDRYPEFDPETGNAVR
jgi:hypothetical protein